MLSKNGVRLVEVCTRHISRQTLSVRLITALFDVSQLRRHSKTLTGLLILNDIPWPGGYPTSGLVYDQSPSLTEVLAFSTLRVFALTKSWSLSVLVLILSLAPAVVNMVSITDVNISQLALTCYLTGILHRPSGCGLHGSSLWMHRDQRRNLARGSDVSSMFSLPCVFFEAQLRTPRASRIRNC